jgi:hypothetical protein
MRIIFCFLVAAGLWLSNSLSIAEQEIPPISASIVVDPIERSADTLLIGIKFKINPGWHIYWKYPGDSGLPTQVRVSAPKGSTVSETLWPTPVRFIQAGGLQGIGYEGEAVLLNRLTVPVAARTEPIKIQARWVGCSQKICVPGKAEFSLVTQDILKNSSITVADLGPWEDKTARALTDNIGKVTTAATRSNLNNKVSNHELVFEWSKSTTQVDWLPVLPRNFKISNLKIETLGKKTVVNFQLERLDSESMNLKELEGEVIISSAASRLSYSHKFNL